MRSSMKGFCRLALCLGLWGFASGLWADVIEHSGPILEDTVWRSADEHLITGDVTVYPQVTLTIEAGATIRVAAGVDSTAGGSDAQRSEIIVNGSLIVDGTEAQPVTFTSNAATPASNDWGGIRFNSRFPFLLRHAVVEYGSVGVDYRVSGAVSASVTIEDSVIRHSNSYGVYLEGSNGASVTARLSNNQIYSHPSQGVYLTNSATMRATIDGNELRDNTSYGLFISNSGTLIGLSVVDNHIHGNTSYGLYVSNNGNAGEPTISGNRVSGNSSTGIYVSTYGSVASLWRIADNEIQNNGSHGLDFYYTNNSGAAVTALVRNNLIADNGSRGVYLHDYYYYYGGGGGKTKAQLNLNRIQGNGSWGIQAERTRGVDVCVQTLSC